MTPNGSNYLSETQFLHMEDGNLLHRVLWVFQELISGKRLVQDQCVTSSSCLGFILPLPRQRALVNPVFIHLLEKEDCPDHVSASFTLGS